MCGIVGYAGRRSAVPFLLEGLKSLEYRGYDSAGIATSNQAELSVSKVSGRLSELEDRLREMPLEGTLGIGHLRWATHGKPSERNAHPHCDCLGRVAVVHNGIIENFADLKEELAARGHRFASDTDSEVISHLIESYFDGNLVSAVLRAVRDLRGAFALAIMSADDQETIVGVRQSSPLMVGLGDSENYLASDAPAILSRTRKAIILDDGEIAVLSRDRVKVLDFAGKELDKEVRSIEGDVESHEKGGFAHFMIKEIHEQPRALADTLRGRIRDGEVALDDVVLDRFDKIYMLACGTSYHACLTGRNLFETIAGIPVEVDLASEFSYRDPLIEGDSSILTVVVSQSGETADTLAALRKAKAWSRVIAVTNAAGSSIAREADAAVYTRAGTEISIASTKAYTTQIEALALLALSLSRGRGDLRREVMEDLMSLDKKVSRALELEPQVKALAAYIAPNDDVFFIGRGSDYPSAMEGQLKLKEVSYIHAEAYAGGELKHGALALITEGVPVVALCTQPSLYEKMASNITEVKARGGWVAALAAEGLAKKIRGLADFVLPMPEVHPLLMPVITAVPLQLLAYHVACEKGRDVDRPRNLAKSVTVE